MTEYLQNITYTGQKIDDFESFGRLPDYLKDFLSRQNGLIAFDGGFHIRGCVLTPKWHSLGYAWDGELKLSALFDNLTPNDIPIAQDCFGDQYLIRDNQIIRLLTETGDLEFLETDFYKFIELVEADPIGILNVVDIDRFDLKPGQLLSVIPPFCIKSKSDRSIKPVDSDERIRFLSSFSRQISNLPDGTNIKIETE
jgi:hypothetical protein